MKMKPWRCSSPTSCKPKVPNFPRCSAPCGEGYSLYLDILHGHIIHFYMDTLYMGTLYKEASIMGTVYKDKLYIDILHMDTLYIDMLYMEYLTTCGHVQGHERLQGLQGLGCLSQSFAGILGPPAWCWAGRRGNCTESCWYRLHYYKGILRPLQMSNQ